MVERGYATAAFSARMSLGDRSGAFVSHLWKDFGANGFYGNAPSHEWTNQTLVAADHAFGPRGGWQLTGAASYRTHGDHFLFDVRRPGVAENRHRTHAVLGSLKASRSPRAGTSITVGVEGGSDWIRSSNLGNHTTQRASAFGEYRHGLGSRTQLEASLRVDRYSEFGTAWSPGVGVGWWASRTARLRASAARAFRVPTFTERYYQDPANWARPEVGAETAWGGDAGADLFLPGGLVASATAFGRLEEDVIDWLRPTAADRWRTYNIRDVDTVGVEVTVSKALRGGAFVQGGYTGVDVRAGAVTQLSKYVLDYAPHTIVAAAALPLPARLRFAPRLELKHRTRSIGTADYALLDARLGRRFGVVEVFVEGTNLLNQPYQEIALVPMPGRAISVSVRLGPV
jgi:iron complex outermembrane receptor protein